MSQKSFSPLGMVALQPMMVLSPTMQLSLNVMTETILTGAE